MSKTEKRQNEQNEEFSAGNKRQKGEIQCSEVEQFVQLDELVHNPGLRHIALQIFSELDPQSHVNCRLVSKGWKDCIDNDKCLMQKQLYQYKCQLEARQRTLFKDHNVTGKAASLKDFDAVMEHVYKNESLDNLKLFTLFMRDYFYCKRAIQMAYNYLGEGTELGPNLGMWTPLNIAAKRNRLDILQICADSPLKILDGNIKGEDIHTIYGTVLGEACMTNQIEVIKFYMNLKGNRRVDFNKHCSSGDSLFHEACRSSNVQVVKLFLDRAEELNIDLNNRDTIWGKPPIFNAVTKEVMQLLLSDDRIDATITDWDGHNVLHNICHLLDSRSKCIVQKEDQLADVTVLLLNSSKVPYIKDASRGWTPLHHACTSWRHFLIENNRMQVILQFIMEGKSIDVNEADDDNGRTAAHTVFESAFVIDDMASQLEDLRWSDNLPPKLNLLFTYATKIGINLDATDNDGRTPLHLLCRYMWRSPYPKYDVRKLVEVARTKYGIELDLNATDNDGMTPMDLI